jgi:RHS repeat-associated protein
VIEDASGWQTRSYGALGEIVRETRGIAGTTGQSPAIYTTRYQHDTWGRLQQLIYPDGEVLTYRYDAGGNVRAAEGVKLGVAFPYLVRLEYDRFEQRAFQQYGNGVRTHYSYDPRRRWLEALDAGDFQRFRYTFDKIGNVETLRNEVSSVPANQLGGRVEQSFTYDTLGRLTQAEGQWHDPPAFRDRYTYSLTYDDIHNIARKTQAHTRRTRKNTHDIEQRATSYDWAYAYGSERPHAATHIGDRSFFYDDNGNQTGWAHDTTGQRRTIAWDEEDRVRSVADSGRTTRFVYDHRGQRVIKAGAQGETAYINQHWTVRNRSIATKHVFVGTDRIVSKLSPGTAYVQPDTDDLLSQMLGNWWEHRSQNGHDHGNNTSANPHYQAPSQMPGDGQPDSNFVYFYHRDHLGSTGFVTASDAELYSHVQYFPSGEPWVDQRANTERLPYLLTDKELDQETGLYYFEARYYDPRTSLWQSTDPAQTEYLNGAGMGSVYNPLNLATYTYAGNDPINYIDPTGRSIWGKLIKFVLKGGDLGATTAGIVDDYHTLTSSKSSWGAKVGAAVSMGSELLPVSVGDAKDAYGGGKQVYRWFKGTDKDKHKASDVRKATKKRFSQKDRDQGFEKSKDQSGTPRCEYCGQNLDRNAGKKNSYEADHRTPSSRGGDSTPENLAPSCRTCNRSKGAKTPAEWTPPKLE